MATFLPPGLSLAGALFSSFFVLLTHLLRLTVCHLLGESFHGPQPGGGAPLVIFPPPNFFLRALVRPLLLHIRVCLFSTRLYAPQGRVCAACSLVAFAPKTKDRKWSFTFYGTLLHYIVMLKLFMLFFFKIVTSKLIWCCRVEKILF